MNMLDRSEEVQDDHTEAYPLASYVDVDLSQVKPAALKFGLTTNQIYALGFRVFCGLCVGFVVFIAAIYYGMINP